MQNKSITYFLLATLFLSISALLIGYFYMQLYLALPPCPLCILARYAIATIALFSFLALAHRRLFIYYWWLAMASLVLGFISNVRHIWLIYNPQSTMCTFDEQPFSIINFLTKAFKGTDDCANVEWTFLTLNIPEQTLILYLALFVLLLLTKRRYSLERRNVIFK